MKTPDIIGTISVRQGNGRRAIVQSISVHEGQEIVIMHARGFCLTSVCEVTKRAVVNKSKVVRA